MRRTTAYALLAVLTAATGGLVWHNLRTANYARVVELMEARDYDRAASELRALIARRGATPELYSDLGFALLSAKRYDEAVLTLEKALSLAGKRTSKRASEDREFLARACLHTGDFERAGRLLLGLLAAPDSAAAAPRLLAALRSVARETGPEALEAWAAVEQAALAGDPRLLALFGDTALETYRFELAERYYTATLAARPDDPQSYLRMGELYRNMHRFEDGARVLAQGLERAPNFAPLHESLGHLYLNWRGPREAIAEYLKAAAADPARADAHAMLGSIYETLGDATAARSHIEAALRIDPNRLDLRSLLERLRAGAARPDLGPRFTLDLVVHDAAGVLAQPSVAGNWSKTGDHDELGGWERRALTRGADGDWRTTIELSRWKYFPYNFILYDGEGRPRHQLGFNPPESPDLSLSVDAAALNLTAKASRPAPELRGRRPTDGRRQVLVVMLDSASWVMLQPLLERGELPYLGGLAAAGARAPLLSPDPFTNRALDHMTRFTRENDTTVKDWLVQIGREVEAYPGPDRLFKRGFLDFFTPEETSVWQLFALSHRSAVNLTFSEAWAFNPDDLLVVDSQGQTSRGSEHMRLPPVDREAVLARFVAPAPAAAHEPALDALLVDAYAHAEGKTALAETYLDEKRPDLTFVVFAESDLLSHRLWDVNFAAWRADAERSPALDAYGRTLERAFVFYDEMIGRLLAKLDGDDTVIICSDHGMQGSLHHDEIGVLIAHGDGVRRGVTLPQMTLLDLPPTLCYLTGAAWPEVPGHRVMEALFTPERLAASPVPAAKGRAPL